MLTAVTIFFTTQAKAAQTAPADTATFVSYCTDATFNDCRLEVVNVFNTEMVNILMGKHGCVYPNESGKMRELSVVATKSVLVWLRANSTTRSPKTYDAIAQAMEALWPNLCVH
jgi:hypothetical protein